MGGSTQLKASGVTLISHTSPSEQRATDSALSPIPELALQPGEPDGRTAAEQWEDWVAQYSAGQWKSDEVPPAPDAILQALAQAEQQQARDGTPDADALPLSAGNDSGLLVYPNSPRGSVSSSVNSSNPTTASLLLAHYRKHGYYPAPKGIYEQERLSVMKQFGLDDPARKEAIERICRLAKAVFKMPTVVITLIFGDEQVMAAETGWDAVDPGMDEPRRRLALDAGVCTHAVTLPQKDATFIIADSAKDWRFRNNPYSVHSGGGLAFYASSSIFLPTGAAPGSGIPEELPVGTICIIDSIPREASAFTQEERSMLRALADMIAREFTLGREQLRRDATAAQSQYLGELLTSSLVNPPLNAAAPPSPSSPNQKAQHSFRPFESSAAQLQHLLNAGSAAILDLRMLDITRTTPSSGPRAAKQIYLLGQSGDVEWDRMVNDEGAELGSAVRHFLSLYLSDDTVTFDASSAILPFASVLPDTSTASCLVPIFDTDGTLALLLAFSSSESRFKFDSADRVFIQNCGSVVLASLLRQRVIDADRAKLSFVSGISHDVRLPLHGISSQIELIRELAPLEQHLKLSPFLDAADVCLESLRDIIDDTLEFAKLTQTTPSKNSNTSRSMASADLEQLAVNVARATWSRKKRVELVSTGVDEPIPDLRDPVEVVLEVEQREGGWKARLDVAGLKRVLLNLIGNSSKFTSEGHIKIRISELPRTTTTPSDYSLIAIDVEDTGCGMSDIFLRDSLFTPFVQENSFVNGAGLGMSICDTIVKRMGGQLSVTSTASVGTTFRLSLPLMMVSPTPLHPSPVQHASSPLALHTGSMEPTRAFRRHLISAELDNSVPSGRPSSSTVNGNGSSPDLSQALEATRVSLEAMLSPSHEREFSASASNGAPAQSPASKGSLAPVPALRSGLAKDNIGKGCKTLIAEDNPIARNILCKLLSGKSVDYQATEDGQLAVDAFRAGQGTFKLFLADIGMPNKDGIEAALEMRAMEKENGWARCRIIALTGLSPETHLVKSASGSLDAPIDRWLVKGGKSLRLIVDEIADIAKGVAAD